MSNWTEEREEILKNEVGNEAPVSRATVDHAAEVLEVSSRSVGAKLRKLGYEVEKAGARPKTFTDEQEEDLRDFVESNANEFTYAEIAEQFEDGTFSARQIQGKILSMELNEFVAPAPEKESVKKYSDEEEAKIVKLANSGAYLEDIASALDRPLNSIRGKALSLLRNNVIKSIPEQRDKKTSVKVDPFDTLPRPTEELTVEEIAKFLEKSERGVKVMLTNRQKNASDYKAKPKKKAA
jgi:hypothetical protein